MGGWERGAQRTLCWEDWQHPYLPGAEAVRWYNPSQGNNLLRVGVGGQGMKNKINLVVDLVMTFTGKPPAISPPFTLYGK